MLARTYSVNQYRHLFKDPRYQTMKRHHPITSEQKVTIDVEIAAVVAVHLKFQKVIRISEDKIWKKFFYLYAQGFRNLRLIEPFSNPCELLVTERSIFAWHADIVRVLSSPLIGP